MITIRNKIFETNSSSTHAIVVPKEVKKDKYFLIEGLNHDYGFGREECRLVEDWDEKLAYIYLILKDYKDWDDGGRIPVTELDIESFKKKVEKIYDFLYTIVEYKPYKDELKPKDVFKKIDNNRSYGFFVDHTEDFSENGFLERILTDELFLMKFLFNREAYITVGGDEYRGYNIKKIGFENDYEEKYYVNEKGEKPPKEWFTKKGTIKNKYYDRYCNEYNVKNSEFWDKLKEYEKENDVYLKGN